MTRCNQSYEPRPRAAFMKNGRELQDCKACRDGKDEAEEQRLSDIVRLRTPQSDSKNRKPEAAA